jgi:hypothetical protein
MQKTKKKEGQRDTEKVVRGSIDVSFLAFHLFMACCFLTRRDEHHQPCQISAREGSAVGLDTAD